MANDFSSVPEAALARLGHQLYQRALVRRDQEPITDPRGQPIGWLLDTRMPMLEGEIFDEIGEVLADRLRAREVYQVAGFGYGSFPIVCSVLGAEGKEDEPGFRGGFIRERRKAYGRRRLVEGPLDRSAPVVLVDDILNSGRSAASTCVAGCNRPRSASMPTWPGAFCGARRTMLPTQPAGFWVAVRWQSLTSGSETSMRSTGSLHATRSDPLPRRTCGW